MDKSRKIFEGRRSTLKKKAGELAGLCNVEVCMICFGPDSDLQVWPENPTEVQSIINKYEEAIKKEKKGKRKENLDLSDLLEAEMKKLEERIHEDETISSCKNFNNGFGVFSLWDEELDALSYNSLMGLSDCLESKIQSLNQMIESLKGTQTVSPSIANEQFEHDYVPFDTSLFYDVPFPSLDTIIQSVAHQ